MNRKLLRQPLFHFAIVGLGQMKPGRVWKLYANEPATGLELLRIGVKYQGLYVAPIDRRRLFLLERPAERYAVARRIETKRFRATSSRS